MITATLAQTPVCSNHGSNVGKQTLRTRYLARRTRTRAANDVVAAREASLPSRLDVLDGVVSG